MKNIRKSVFAVLAATILATVFIITACQQPMDGFSFGGGGATSRPIPAGKGLVSLSLGKTTSPAKTILPVNSITANQAKEYHLEFQDTAQIAPLGYEDYWVVPADMIAGKYEIALDPATYTLDVTAYTTAAGTGNTTDFADGKGYTTGPVYNIVIAAGTPTAVTVDLELYDHKDLTVDGSTVFTFTLTSLSTLGLDTHTIDIIPQPLTTASGAINNRTINNGANSINTLEPGVYDILIKLTRGTFDLEYAEVLHLYQNLTTDFTYQFTANLFPPIGGEIEINDPTFPSDLGTLGYTGNLGTGGGHVGKVITFDLEGGTNVAPITLTLASASGTTKWWYSSAASTTGVNFTIDPTAVPWDGTNGVNSYVISVTDDDVSGSITVHIINRT